MKQGIIYISGPMTGIQNLNAPEFNRTERELEALGWEVRNPVRRIHKDRRCGLREDIADLVDGVLFDGAPGTHGQHGNEQQNGYPSNRQIPPRHFHVAKNAPRERSALTLILSKNWGISHAPS